MDKQIWERYTKKKVFFLAASLSLKFDGISLKSTFAVELTLASKIAELGGLRQEEEMQWRGEKGGGERGEGGEEGEGGVQFGEVRRSKGRSASTTSSAAEAQDNQG